VANLKAFKGVMYNQDKLKIGNVIAPPYDVIPRAYQNELYERDPHNVIRLILGREENWHASAANYFKEWREKNILTSEKIPTLYYLVQEFKSEGKKYTRSGFIALCELIEFSKGVVLPHEKTLSKPKADRFELMKASNASFEQIFTMYTDKEKLIDKEFAGLNKTTPAFDVTFEGIRNIIWKLQDEKKISKIIELMKDKQLYIADGHHRYETGILYRNFRKESEPNYKGDEPYNYILMYMCNIDDPGLVILPTHRAIFGLENFNYSEFKNKISEHFSWVEFNDKGSALNALKSHDVHAYIIKFQDKNEFVLIKLKDDTSIDKLIPENISKTVKNLDVSLLHNYILEKVLGINKEAQAQKLNLDYEKDADSVLELLKDKKYQMSFIINATKINEIVNISNEGNVMPQKSTYFYPKLYSGFIFNPFSEE
jgi:uncharacterized protein (DUF1015 family)